MKSINLDIRAVVDALQGKRELNKSVGFAKDVHGTFYTVFIATDQDSGQPVWTKDEKRLRFNIRKSLNQGN
jgi:hypothetical protein